MVSATLESAQTRRIEESTRTSQASFRAARTPTDLVPTAPPPAAPPAAVPPTAATATWLPPSWAQVKPGTTRFAGDAPGIRTATLPETRRGKPQGREGRATGAGCAHQETVALVAAAVESAAIWPGLEGPLRTRATVLGVDFRLYRGRKSRPRRKKPRRRGAPTCFPPTRFGATTL